MVKIEGADIFSNSNWGTECDPHLIQETKMLFCRKCDKTKLLLLLCLLLLLPLLCCVVLCFVVLCCVVLCFVVAAVLPTINRNCW